MRYRNQNRPGYRKTKAGWVPKDWETPSIGMILESSQYGCNAPAIDGGNTPVVGMKNLQDGIIDLEGLAHTNLSDKERESFLLKKGDVLINRTNSYDLVGKAGIFDSDEKVAFVSYLVRLSGKRDRINQKFLNYWLNSYQGQKSIKRLATKGVSQANVNPTEVKKHCHIPLCSLREQEAIAEVLECWDKAIRNYEKKIEKKRNIKKGLMQRLLSGKQRLPGFSDEWKKVRVGEVSSVKTGPFGAQLHESDYVDAGTPIITVEHLSESGIRHCNLPLVSDADKERLSQYILRHGDVVFSRVGSVDRNSLISENETGWLFSGRLLRVRPNLGFVCPMYLSCYFHQQTFRNHMRSIAVGGTMACLNTRLLSRVFVKLPSLSEQEAIAKVFLAANDEIDAFEQKLARLKDQKKFLLNSLVTGTIRLPEFRDAAESTATPNGDHE
jgi:type I restriction enzyme S subunit